MHFDISVILSEYISTKSRPNDSECAVLENVNKVCAMTTNYKNNNMSIESSQQIE